MTNDKLNPNDEIRKEREEIPACFVRHSCFDIPSSFVIRVSSFFLPIEYQTIIAVQARPSSK